MVRLMEQLKGYIHIATKATLTGTLFGLIVPCGSMWLGWCGIIKDKGTMTIYAKITRDDQAQNTVYGSFCNPQKDVHPGDTFNLI